jgi:hypothetical protein
MQSVRVNDRGATANLDPNTPETLTVVAYNRPTAYDFEPHHKNVPCSYFNPPLPRLDHYPPLRRAVAHFSAALHFYLGAFRAALP